MKTARFVSRTLTIRFGTMLTPCTGAGCWLNVRRLLFLAVFLCFASTSFAQLTHQQKLTDFQALVALYDKNYAPYEWKVETFNYDLLRLQPWLEQVNSSHDDLSFYDICVRYVASLQDSHALFVIPSYYEAYLPITADIYDGRVLIDFIDRTVLPPQTFPFAAGDELLSVDGISVGEWIAKFGPYGANGQGNPVSRNRLAVATILDRLQDLYPYSNQVHPGDTATIEVRGQNGSVGTYTLTWEAFGIPLNQIGPVPNPGPRAFAGKSAFAQSTVKRPMRQLAQAASNPWGVWTGAEPDREVPAVPKGLERIQRLQNFAAFEPAHVVAGSIFPFNSRFPVFNPPPGFHLRLGAKATDEFVSGTFPAGNRTVGFIRIPSFSPASRSRAIQQFQSEITFFQQNTSGLVIDIMSNGGGNICYANNIVQFLSPQPFQALPGKLRATEQLVLDLESLLLTKEFHGGSASDINLLNDMIDELQEALAENRGLTGPIQIYSPVGFCNSGSGLVYPPASDAQGNNIAYTKPILLLTDNFTISSAEFFAAILQDENRVSVYGVRTDGGGGNVVAYEFNAAPYSEGEALVTQSILVRNHDISTPGLPSAPYIENIGIQPDFVADYQTRTNLLTGGQPFLSGFSTVIGNLINAGHQ
jgi:peptidase S41-like protein/PDZ domain-containing protein